MRSVDGIDAGVFGDSASRENGGHSEATSGSSIAEEDLLRDLELSSSLLESMADGVVACDARGELALFNRAAREWHGVDPMRLPAEEWARHYDLYRYDGVTPLPTEEIPLARAYRGEAFRDVGMAIVAKGKPPRFILANGCPIQNATGEKVGAVVVMRDVTELRRADDALRRANEDLERRVTDRTAALEEANRRLQRELQERQRAQEAARANLVRFEDLFNKAVIPLCFVDKEGGELLFNTAFEKTFGYSRDEVPTLNEWWTLAYPDEEYRESVIRTCEDVLQKALEAGTDIEPMEYRVTCKSGDVLTMVVFGSMTGGDLLLTFFDVTERNANLHFLESMDRVNRAIQGADDLDAMRDVLDAVLSILDCDRAFLLHPCDPGTDTWSCQMESTKPGCPGVRELGMAVPMGADVAETLTVLLQAEGPVQFGPRTGHPLPADVAQRFGFRNSMGMAIRPKVGMPWQFGVHQCCRERVWTPEEELLFREIGRRLTDALTGLLVRRDLRESQRRLAEAQRIAHVGYWERDFDAQTITLSDESCRIFGLSPGDVPIPLREWHSRWMELIHPGDQPRLRQAAEDALRDGLPYDVEYRVVRSGGEVRFVHSEGVVNQDAAGRPVSMTGMMQDITERKTAEKEIRRLNLELEQRVADRTSELEASNQELEAFAYSVSHDLRAPLRHVDGFVHLLANRIAPTEDEDARHYMDVIAESAARMGQLIDDLLAFSRMGRAEMARGRVELDPLVREAVAELAPEAAGRKVRWRVAELPAVIGDRMLLRTVLDNLLGNALKFTRPREVAEIEVGWQPGDAGEIVIYVRDNGVGFDPSYANKLFGVFQRLHRSDDFEGTGIGLANVHRIVARHGGRTWARGTSDGGATFFFSLPAPEEDE